MKSSIHVSIALVPRPPLRKLNWIMEILIHIHADCGENVLNLSMPGFRSSSNSDKKLLLSLFGCLCNLMTFINKFYRSYPIGWLECNPCKSNSKKYWDKLEQPNQSYQRWNSLLCCSCQKDKQQQRINWRNTAWKCNSLRDN